MEQKQNLSLTSRYLSSRKTYMYRKRKDIFKLAELMASLTASCCLTLSASKLMFLYSICTLRQWIKFSILSSLFQWNSFCFVAAAILFPAFAALTEILFRLHQFFSDFQAPFARLKILAWFEQPGLDFQPGLNYSPCNRQFDFKIIRFRSRAEIPHVIRP